MVNGVVVGTFDQDGVYDGDVFSLGYVHAVDIPTAESTIEIRAAGGEEYDWGFWDPDDDLPIAVKVHSQSDNWGIGSQSVPGADDEFNYVLYYTISCLEQRSVSFATRGEVLAFVRSSAKERMSSLRITFMSVTGKSSTAKGIDLYL